MQAGDVLLVGVGDNGNDQAAAVIQRDRETHIDVVVINDIGAVDGGVENRELANRLAGRGGDKRQKRQAKAVLRLERGLALLADLGDGGHVHFVNRGDMGRGVQGMGHVFGDLLAHRGHGLDAELGGFGAGRGRGKCRLGGRCGGLGYGAFNVLLRDAPAGAGAGDSGEIDFIFTRHLADERRERTEFLNRGSGWRGRRSNRRGLNGDGSLDRRGCGGYRLNDRDRGNRRGSGRAIADPRNHRVDGDGLPFLHKHFREYARGRRRDFGIHLIRRDFKQRFVALHLVAGLLQPARQRTFHNTFAHLGHYDIRHANFSVS